ncbi:MAG: hypothetical protein HY906_28390 [Deltaproteobacteria bacterium]|nr:hypothetical protein [Deltaproteobacteria bacterium]
MSEPESEPLAPDIQRLVETGRSYHPTPGPAARARLEAQIMAQGPAAAPSTPAAVAAGSGVLAKPFVVGIAAFVFGLGGGAGLHAALQRGGDRRGPATPSRPAPAVAPGCPSSTPANTPVVQLPPAAPAAPCSCPTARAPASTHDRDAELAAERALLETARTALGRREAAAALEILARHERAFPQGRLVEEREAITVQALLVEAHYDLVRARGARFLRGYPRSLFRPAVEDALRRAADVDPTGWRQ